MSAAQTLRRIAAGEDRLARLKPWVETLTAAKTKLQQSLPLPGERTTAAEEFEARRVRDRIEYLDHGPRGANGASFGVPPEVEQGFQESLPGLLVALDEVSQLEAGIPALRASLPSAEAVARGQAEADAAVQAAERARDSHAEGLAELLALFETAEGLAHDLATDAGTVTRETSRARGLAEELGLDLDPGAARPEPGERAREYVGAVSRLCTEALYGELDPATIAVVGSTRPVEVGRIAA
jgi:hypothetical protein